MTEMLPFHHPVSIRINTALRDLVPFVQFKKRCSFQPENQVTRSYCRTIDEPSVHNIFKLDYYFKGTQKQI